MARAARTTKSTAPVAEETVEATAEEQAAETAPSPKQIVNEGINRVVEATGIDVQKSRYKAMRAIAYQAFLEAIESGDFDGLVDRALENAADLPSGWELEVTREDAPTPTPTKAARGATAKATPAKAPAKAAAAKATTTTRKRPTR